MKNVLVLFFAVVAFTARSQTTYDDPIKYNDFIVEEQNKIGEKIMSFMDEFEAGTLESAQGKNDELLEQINSGIKVIDTTPPVEDGKRMKESVLRLFKFYKSVCETEYNRMVELYFSDDYSDDDQAEITKMIDDVTQREAVYDEEFAAAQEEFAKAHDFILEENDLQEEFDNGGK